MYGSKLGHYCQMVSDLSIWWVSTIIVAPSVDVRCIVE